MGVGGMGMKSCLREDKDSHLQYVCHFEIFQGKNTSVLMRFRNKMNFI